MSVDALLFAPDKAAASQGARGESSSTGSRLVFTSADYHRQPAGRPPQVDDHRPLLTAAGFDVLAYDETEDWRRRSIEYGRGVDRERRGARRRVLDRMSRRRWPSWRRCGRRSTQ